MNRLPSDFNFDPPKPPKGKYLNSPKLKGITSWHIQLSEYKSNAIRKFLEEQYPDKVFTPEEVARNAHCELPTNNPTNEEELFIWQGRPSLHFKWSNKNKTFEAIEL